MIKIIDILFLNLLFTLVVVKITLLGVLVAEFFERDKGRRSIAYMMALVLVVAFKVVLDNYIYFQSRPSEILIRADLYLDIFPVGMTIAVLYLLWKKLDKRIITVLISFMVFIVSVNFFKTFSKSPFLDILKIIALTGVNFSLYFLIIKFLVDSSESDRKKIVKKRTKNKSR